MTLRIMLVLALVLAGAAVAEAQPGPPPPGRGMGPGPGEIDELADELGLKAAQRQSIRDIADEARKKQAKLRADLEVVEIDLRRELEKDEPDEKKVIAYIDQLSVLEGEMRKTNVVAWLKIRKVLSKEQRAKLDAHHEQMRKERRKNRPKGPPPPHEGDVLDPFGGDRPPPPKGKRKPGSGID